GLRRDRVDALLEAAARLGEVVVAPHRRDAVRQLELLVVFEEHEASHGDRRVAGEEQPDVDLSADERLHRERTAGVERLEVLEGDAVLALETERAELAVRALRRATEDELVPDRRKVGELRELELVRGRFGHDKTVLVDGGRVVENGDGPRRQGLLQCREGQLRIGRAGRRLIDEREERGEIVRLQVDLPALERGEDDLAGAEVELARDRVPVGLEDLAVELAERALLAAVR